MSEQELYELNSLKKKIEDLKLELSKNDISNFKKRYATKVISFPKNVNVRVQVDILPGNLSSFTSETITIPLDESQIKFLYNQHINKLRGELYYAENKFEKIKVEKG